MAGEKVKYNKTALKAQRDGLAKYERFLPILQLKKMQLQIVLRQLEPVIERKRGELLRAGEGIQPWSSLLSDPAADVHEFLKIATVETSSDNIAGVEVPEFREVVFEPNPYSLFVTPSWLDRAVEALQHLISLREELRVLREREALIREELRTTTQRCNLFEKKLIPEFRENIRRIKIFLGDQETAAVGRAKLGKAKIDQREVAQP